MDSAKRSKGGAKRKRKGSSKYERGTVNRVKGVQDKKLRAAIEAQEGHFQEAAQSAAAAEVLLPAEAGYLEAEGMERTFKFKQRDIQEHVDIATQRSAVDLRLPEFGPYTLGYTRSGRHAVLAGGKGHMAVVDALRMSVVTEFHVREAVHAVSFLHNETLFAAAQKKYVYIYDNTGLEVHCLREHGRVRHLTFLPYHFLLATIGEGGVLQYRDVSTGAHVAQHRSKLGPCACMAHNPHNAVVHTGHNNGVVNLWSPTVGTPLVKMLCHKGPVRALDVDLGGRTMVTAGADGQMKVWDLRNFQCKHAYFNPTPASTLAISQRGLLAVGFGPHVQVWKNALEGKAKSPYMNHSLPGSHVQQVQFRPYEDFLGVGHASGLCNMVVPGAGEPNFDSFVANPFETKKQRREHEVQSLLDKLQPEMIALDPGSVVGVVDTASQQLRQQERKEAQDVKQLLAGPAKQKNKTRGRSKIGRKLKRKQKNVWTEEKEKLSEALKQDKEQRARQNNPQMDPRNNMPSSLHRFVRKQ